LRLTDFSFLFCGVLLNALAQLGLKAATRVTGPLIATDAGVWQRALNLLAVPSLWYALCAYGLCLIVSLVCLCLRAGCQRKTRPSSNSSINT